MDIEEWEIFKIEERVEAKNDAGGYIEWAADEKWCRAEDVEKVEQENAALHVKNEKLGSLTDELYAMLDELGE